MELELNGEARSSQYKNLKLSIIYNKEIQIDASLPSNVGDMLNQLKILNK